MNNRQTNDFSDLETSRLWEVLEEKRNLAEAFERNLKDRWEVPQPQLRKYKEIRREINELETELLLRGEEVEPYEKWNGMDPREREFRRQLRARRDRAGPQQANVNRRPTTWDDIEISFLSEQRVQIRVQGELKPSMNYGDLGFDDKRNGNPNQAWYTLLNLAESNGTLEAGTGRERRNREKRIQEIRNALRTHFEIASDRLPFDSTSKGYRAKFKISTSTSYNG